jgi:hypothetical protein
MSRELKGWTLDDLLFFLKSHNFSIIKNYPGSHDLWKNLYTKKIANIHRLHNNSGYNQLTLRAIVVQMGYNDKYARGWRKMNKTKQKEIAKKIKKEQSA